ncbi:hypothetical protein CH373_06870 [Leptospira perolatii]|uniref:Lipoprotein n=2 Tax=Leptospira perolatii TaxID=2023191 RepID=A0A2M9ZPP1_9LEPT|nr:hypothetical protein [Leptospira perolatii]PJZ70919.1 hypothetical protein CH360_03730 [Leptospira perolatii]PJZ74042.1 hypothetical protein CH373_06870 [Leptospira perolatii]
MFLGALILSSFIQCATASAGLSTSTIPMADKKYKVLGPVEGQETWFTFDIAIIGIPFHAPPIDKLVDSLQKSKEADALINIRYWNDKFVLLFLTINRFHISAEAVKFEEDSTEPGKKKGR